MRPVHDASRVEVFRLDEGPNAGRWAARLDDFGTVCDSHGQAMAAASVLVQLEQCGRAERRLREYATSLGYRGPNSAPASAHLPSAAELDRARLDTAGAPDA